MTVLFTLLTGIAYPLAITGIGQLAFPVQANGSLIRNGDAIVGSSLIGQNFSGDRLFLAAPFGDRRRPYNAGASTGSNLGPTSAAAEGAGRRPKSPGCRPPVSPAPLPADAATASGSGLDPDISPEYARAQAARVAKARDLPQPQVAALIEHLTEGRLLGIIGRAARQCAGSSTLRWTPLKARTMSAWRMRCAILESRPDPDALLALAGSERPRPV